ncbi:MAG: Ger(x)C family spore germination protein [Firmicutes bacterium]|nr:Ger(x)C family spore germination protein [Bacillota bacterium]
MKDIIYWPRTVLGLILIGLVMFSGCWGSKEIDEAAYLLALGIDAGPGRDLVISTVVANPGANSRLGGNTSSLAANTVRVFTAEAPAIFSGFNIINTILENQLEPSHTKMVIFGEELARRNIEPYMDTLTRWRKFRRTFYIAVAQGEARQVIESIIPPAGYNGAKFIETMFTSQAYVGYTPENQMLRFYNSLKAKGEDPVAALVAPRITKYGLTMGQESRIISGAKDFKTGTGDPGRYTAGNPPLSGEGSLQFLGTAIFRRGKMVDKLTGNETMAFKMFQGELSRAFISVPDPKAPGRMIEVELSQIRKPRIKVVRDGEGFRAKVHLTLLGDIAGIQSNRQYETPQSISLLQRQIQKWAIKQCRGVFNKARAAGSDIFGFGNFARWLAPDWEHWQKWDWNSEFKAMKLDLTVKAHVNRTGLIIKKDAVRGE